MEERFERNGLRVRIIQDEFPEPPNQDPDALMFCHFHERQCWVVPDDLPFERGIPDSNGAQSWMDGLARFIHETDEWVVFLVDAYIHSGVVLATSGSAKAGNFPDRRWDVSQVGAVLVKRDAITWTKDLRELVQSYLDSWNQYLSGDVWGYTIERSVTCEHCNHTEYEEVDSLWGIYSLDECVKEATSAVPDAAAGQ